MTKKTTLFPTHLIAFVLSTMLIFSISACSENSYPDDNSDLGEQLVRDMWKHMGDKNWTEIENSIAQGFQSVHSDGARSRSEEIDLIKKLNINDYTLDNFITTRNGDVLVVTYTISVAETINNERLSSSPAVRQTVWLNTGDKWKWIAHANLKPLENTESEYECHKTIAQTAVHNTAVGLGSILRDSSYKTNQLAIVRSYIEDIRFYPDNSGYFYIYNMEGVCVAHPIQKDIVGVDLWDKQDEEGNYVIRNLAEAAKKGGGFVEYYWNNPLTGKDAKKIGYVEPIPGTDLFIGDGLYLK
ncbi:MAG: cache domain-containing protein [Candidatus Kapaibacterium sp.]